MVRGKLYPGIINITWSTLILTVYLPEFLVYTETCFYLVDWDIQIYYNNIIMSSSYTTVADTYIRSLAPLRAYNNYTVHTHHDYLFKLLSQMEGSEVVYDVWTVLYLEIQVSINYYKKSYGSGVLIWIV